LTAIAAANTSSPITVPQAVLYQEVRSELSTSLDRGLHQHLIELSASWGISPSYVSHPNVPSNQREISEVGEMGGKGRAVRTNDSLQKTPVGKPLWTMPVDEVSPRYITGNNSSIEKQYSMTVAGQQHCRCCARATGANHNRVVHITSGSFANCRKEMLTENQKLGL